MVLLESGVLKIYKKFTGEQPCRNVISIKLLFTFTEITIWYGCSINLLHIITILWEHLWRTPSGNFTIKGNKFSSCFFFVTMLLNQKNSSKKQRPLSTVNSTSICSKKDYIRSLLRRIIKVSCGLMYLLNVMKEGHFINWSHLITFEKSIMSTFCVFHFYQILYFSYSVAKDKVIDKPRGFRDLRLIKCFKCLRY